MKRTSFYLLLTVIGTLLPNIFVFKESLESGNILLWLRPLDTFEGMFANNISSAFALDLLFIVCLFLVWSFRESKRLNLKGIAWVWLYTFGLGIAGGLPLFLFLREKTQHNQPSNQANSGRKRRENGLPFLSTTRL